MIRVFENAVKKSKKKVDVDTSVCAFFFGPIYLAFKGLWTHVLIWFAIVLPMWIVFDDVGLLISMALISIIYAAKIQAILIKRYLRKGWTEVTEKISTPYEILQARLYVDSIQNTYTNVSTLQLFPTRACQFCTAEVSVDAVKCHFCRSHLSPETEPVRELARA